MSVSGTSTWFMGKTGPILMELRISGTERYYAE